MSSWVALVALAGVAVFGVLAGLSFAVAGGGGAIGPALHIVNNGRHLTPYGRTTVVGNAPMGAALTPDGRFYWTVSAGAGLNDVRIVSAKTGAVIQTLPLPGASGGIAIGGGRAFVSGLQNSTNKGTSRSDLPGGAGDVIHVFKYSKASGKATETGQIAVPPPPGTAGPEDFPIHANKALSYPEHLAATPDGKTLLVPLGLADAAAIVQGSSVRYVPVGHYPYGAAILPGGRRGLVTNETPGTVSVIDMRKAQVVKTIDVGGHLAHPEAVVAPAGKRAYVAVTNRDNVAVLNTSTLTRERYLADGVHAGIGTAPDAVAVTANGRQLLVANSGSDAISVWGIPSGRSHAFKLQGRVPTARYPTDVHASGGKSPQLFWLSMKGLGTGPNPNGPNPFNSSTLDQTASTTQFLPRITDGSTGVGALPNAKSLRKLTKQADAQLPPANLPHSPPAGTPLRSGGPIKHVFFIVRENRTYDQVLGDDTRGAGDKSLTLFGQDTTPNLHALVQRFPLVDHLYADSEASQQGHQWTSAGSISDYSEKNWNQISNVFGSYGARGRPLQTGIYTAAFPPKGYLFDQALRQNISFFNYGETYAGNIPLPYAPVSLLANTTDKDRTAQDAAQVQAKFDKSDLGPGVAGGCYPGAFYVGPDILTGKWAFDSSVPPGAPAGSESRFDCFKQHFDQQVAAGGVPSFNYLTLTNDHTQGLSPNAYTPQAMIADNDLATAQVVDLISHSPIWAQSAIFVVEDDSQDGADHVDAHRIPVAVISPYAKPAAVVSTRYDQLSVLRSMELILGMQPLSLNDSLATPMYDAFDSTPTNLAPFTALPETQDLLAKNPGGTSLARQSARLDFRHLDGVPQRKLDGLLWKAVHGPDSTPPAPGPNAVRGHDANG
jgi:DNA-binding beta-propeller fold protein YncE